MSCGFLSSDLIGCWSLSFSDIDFVNRKPELARLGLGVAAQILRSARLLCAGSCSNPGHGVVIWPSNWASKMRP